MKLVQLILRPLALVLALPIVGMAAYQVHHHGPSGRPAIVGYILFCGLWAVLVAAMGLATAFVDRLTLPQFILDVLAHLFLIAGGIALAVQTGARSCNPGQPANGALPARLYNPPWIANGYTGATGNGNVGWYRNLTSYDGFVSRCRMAQATVAFLFFTWALLLVSSVLTFREIGKRRASRRTSVTSNRV